MTLRKRLKVLYAALTQTWTVFTCPCGAQSWVMGSGKPLLDGLLCEACEAREMAKWAKDFEARMEREKGAA